MSTNNPYIGLRTYDENHRHNFWGRDEDTKRLADSIIENTSTLIYGCSGCGKSSMINAGLIPTLRYHEMFGMTYRFLPIKIKPHDCIKGNEGSFRLWSAVSDAIDNYVIKLEEVKGYSIRGEEIESKEMGGLSLWEKLNLITYRDKDDNPINFLVIIDQFEEIFHHRQHSCRKLCRRRKILHRGCSDHSCSNDHHRPRGYHNWRRHCRISSC